jgi:hypothetical protein
VALASDLRNYLSEVARRIDAAGHGQTAPIVSEAMTHLGWSRDKLYRRLKSDIGWSSGRKDRTDKGCTCVPLPNLDKFAALQRESLRANGKQILFTPTAASIAEANGIELPVSNGHLNKLIRDRKLNVDAMRLINPPRTLRSLHANHVHQVDPSLCVIYYLRDGRQMMMDADKFYKNKFDNYAKVKLKVWRYVLWDHSSSMIVCKYFEARGENPSVLFDFLMWAWSVQSDREFHGVPRILVWDKGSANTSTSIKSLLEALEVRAIEHAAGQARVKGGVEGAQNIIETKFESRLKLEKVHDVDQLNAAALAWQNAFNAGLIPRENCLVRRTGAKPIARYDLWRRIKAEQLRELPPVEVCRPLLEGREQSRKVSNYLSISYRHPAAERTRLYRVAGLDGICAGDEIHVRPLLFGDCAIHVRVPRYDGADLVYRLDPEAAPDEAGFPVDAPVWGESFKGVPHTAIERNAKRMDEIAFPGEDARGVDKQRQKQAAPFGGQLDAHSHLSTISLPTGLPRRGSEISVPDRMQIEARPMNHVQMAAALARAVPGWGPETYGLMTRLYPDGVLEADLEMVALRLAEAPRLVAVG